MEELFLSGDDGYGDMGPDAISYTSVMNDWAGCGSRAAPRRSEQILRHTGDLQDAGNAAAVPDKGYGSQRGGGVGTGRGYPTGNMGEQAFKGRDYFFSTVGYVTQYRGF